MLRRAGYKTILSGKMHFIGPDQFHGFEERLTADIYPASFIWTPDWDRGPHLNPGSNMEQIRHSGTCETNLQLDYDEEVHFRALQRLRRLAGGLEYEPEATPFFMCVSYTHPHDPFVTTSRWWDLYEGANIPLPNSPAMPMEEMDSYNQWIQIHHGADCYPLNERQIHDARRAYYGMVSYFDDKVGELIGELKRLGLYERTTIIVTSDHGEMLGEHGMWFKRTFFDEAAKVPMIVSLPGYRQKRVVREVVSLVDLFPTLCELGGIDLDKRVREEMDGHSLVGLITGRDLGWVNEAYLEYCGEGAIRPMRMLRAGKYKYVYVEGLPALLFDLERDPHSGRTSPGNRNTGSWRTA
jgi:choline-sulfatase